MPESSATRTILVVDDERPIRKLLELNLQGAGYSVLLAASGEEAVAVFRKQRPSIALVLMDHKLPGMDGETTMATLRKLDPSVRCCFMTGINEPRFQQELTDQGAIGVLAKPFGLNEMVRFVRQTLGEQETE